MHDVSIPPVHSREFSSSAASGSRSEGVATAPPSAGDDRVSVTGVNAGEKVVTVGVHSLTNGQAVKL